HHPSLSLFDLGPQQRFQISHRRLLLPHRLLGQFAKLQADGRHPQMFALLADRGVLQREVLQDTTIRQQCKHLRMPTIGLQFRKLAEEAVREQQTPVRYLEALLGAEIEERERRVVERRIHEAHLPRMKTLEEFDFAQAPKVPATQIRELAEGGYVERAEPVL